MTSTNAQSRATSFAAPPASELVVALVVSTALILGSFALQHNYGFNIGDESFLWYGVQRIQAGETPLLDFSSYDPGRYYWSTAFLILAHDDRITTLRGAAAVFQALGLFVGLRLLLRGKSKPDLLLLALAAITFLTWMFTWYKAYDTSASILLIGALTLLVDQPSHRNFVISGIIVGLVAVFGRNEGLYGIVGILGASAYLACQQRSMRGLTLRLACCAGGVIIGYSPILFMIVVIPGFAGAFWESIAEILNRGTTNLPLPVPWPWLTPVAKLHLMTAATGVLTGTFFVALIAFGLLANVSIIRQALQQRPVSPQFVAASMLALPFAHYAFSRPDLFHLALGIFPFLIGIFLLLAELPRRVRWLGALVMTGTSLFLTLPEHPGWSCRTIEKCVTVELGGSTLKIEPQIASFVIMLQRVTAKYAPNDQNFLVTPLWPGAYALFNRRSPMWEIYALFPRDRRFQEREIERIKVAKPAFALILDIAVDGRDEMRFQNSHPLIDQYIRDNFAPVVVEGFPPPVFRFYKARH